MKRLTKAQSELIDAFLDERAGRISTAQVEKDFLGDDHARCMAIGPSPVLQQRITLLGSSDGRGFGRLPQ